MEILITGKKYLLKYIKYYGIIIHLHNNMILLSAVPYPEIPKIECRSVELLFIMFILSSFMSQMDH